MQGPLDTHPHRVVLAGVPLQRYFAPSHISSNHHIPFQLVLAIQIEKGAVADNLVQRYVLSRRLSSGRL